MVNGKIWFSCIICILLLSFSYKYEWNNHIASYYTVKENGRHTASGIPLSDKKLTAASNVYPLKSKVLIKRVGTDDSVIVKITDRISKRYGDKRIDITKTAFKELGSLDEGLIPVVTKQID